MEFTSTRPVASASVTDPWTECSVMMPLPPVTSIEPSTVSALIAPRTPSTSISVYVPLSVRAMSCGTVMSKSTTEGAPCRLPARSVRVLPASEASTLPRLPCSACTLTRFCVHAWTTIEPPKLLTDRLAPAGTAIVVSVSPCTGASETMTAAARIVNMLSSILSRTAPRRSR